MISFVRGKFENYDATKYADAIYFAEDTQEIILDGKSYGGSYDITEVLADKTWKDEDDYLTTVKYLKEKIAEAKKDIPTPDWNEDSFWINGSHPNNPKNFIIGKTHYMYVDSNYDSTYGYMNFHNVSTEKTEIIDSTLKDKLKVLLFPDGYNTTSTVDGLKLSSSKSGNYDLYPTLFLSDQASSNDPYHLDYSQFGSKVAAIFRMYRNGNARYYHLEDTLVFEYSPSDDKIEIYCYTSDPNYVLPTDWMLTKHNVRYYKLDEKYLPESILRKSDIEQSDWYENDSTSMSYIKNRTHYDARVFTPIFDFVGVYNYENNITYSPVFYAGAGGWRPGMDQDYNGFGESILNFFTENDSVTEEFVDSLKNVTFYNVTYHKPITVNQLYKNGNGLLIDLRTTDEDGTELQQTISLYTQIGSTRPDVSITSFPKPFNVGVVNSGIIKQLSEEFIPDTIARTSDLTRITNKLDTLIDNDTNKSVREIANEELVSALIPEDAQESLDTLQEIANWIQQHPDDAAAMAADIEELKNKSAASPDWQENDISSSNYIANRTHFVIKTGSSKLVNVPIASLITAYNKRNSNSANNVTILQDGYEATFIRGTLTLTEDSPEELGQVFLITKWFIKLVEAATNKDFIVEQWKWDPNSKTSVSTNGGVSISQSNSGWFGNDTTYTAGHKYSYNVYLRWTPNPDDAFRKWIILYDKDENGEITQICFPSATNNYDIITIGDLRINSYYITERLVVPLLDKYIPSTVVRSVDLEMSDAELEEITSEE